MIFKRLALLSNSRITFRNFFVYCMKIIVNRGFERFLTRVVVFKNAQEIVACPIKKDYCEFSAKEGDQIVIKLKSLGASALTVACFDYHEWKDTFYVGPTMLCKIWELFNFKILPYICLLLLAIGAAIESDTYSWFCAGMIVLTALSLIIFLACMLIHPMRKRLFQSVDL